jgi:hypothetical protein
MLTSFVILLLKCNELQIYTIKFLKKKVIFYYKLMHDCQVSEPEMYHPNLPLNIVRDKLYMGATDFFQPVFENLLCSTNINQKHRFYENYKE